MKVAMVSEHASPLAALRPNQISAIAGVGGLGGADAGGQNVHVAALATAIARRGVQVTVYTRRDRSPLPRVVHMAPGVAVEHVDAGPARPLPKDELLPHMDAFSAWLRRTFLEDPPDIVHAHFWMSAYAALKATKTLGIPVTVTFHALGIVKRRHQGAQDTSPAERLAIEQDVIGQAEQIIATCSDEVFELVRLGADRKRVRVVPCGVDLRAFCPDGPAEPRSAHPRLVVVSRFVARKGIDDAIRALAQLSDAELIVAGGPSSPHEFERDPETRRLRAIARELRVEGRVDFRGGIDRDAVPRLLRSADIVVSVPWYEPFGIVPVEAMACGVPVISSAVGGQIDTVVDGVTGLHVPPRDPATLARAIKTLLEDSALRHRLGTAAARRAREKYGHDHVARETLAAYERVCARPGRRTRAVARSRSDHMWSAAP
jgi:glycosyltransferase involved in cell wall biosynthesis